MKIFQTTNRLKPFTRGFHLITHKIEDAISVSDIQTGLVNLFIKHTSASLSINENFDPSVKEDMENFFSDIADAKRYYIHIYEGSDDMLVHIKNSLLGNSLTIPVTDGKLNLETWQGIYLGEHRESAHAREIVITLQGE